MAWTWALNLDTFGAQREAVNSKTSPMPRSRPAAQGEAVTRRSCSPLVVAHPLGRAARG